jgi:Ferritin-like domain
VAKASVSRMPAKLNRRSALGAGAGALVLASCGGGDPPPSGRPRAGSGAGLLNSIVALENAGVAAWAAIREQLRGEARRYADTIHAREAEHVRRLSALVRELGGTPPEGRPAEEYARSFPRIETPSDALRFAADLEERLLRAYLDALRSLPEEAQRRAAAEIAAEEAEDLAVVHVLAGEPAAPQPFVTGTL